jgi:hypothetical protein
MPIYFGQVLVLSLTVVMAALPVSADQYPDAAVKTPENAIAIAELKCGELAKNYEGRWHAKLLGSRWLVWRGDRELCITISALNGISEPCRELHPNKSADWINIHTEGGDAWLDLGNPAHSGFMITFQAILGHASDDPRRLALKTGNHGEFGIDCKSHTEYVLSGVPGEGWIGPSPIKHEALDHTQIFKLACSPREP